MQYLCWTFSFLFKIGSQWLSDVFKIIYFVNTFNPKVKRTYVLEHVLKSTPMLQGHRCLCRGSRPTAQKRQPPNAKGLWFGVLFRHIFKKLQHILQYRYVYFNIENYLKILFLNRFHRNRHLRHLTSKHAFHRQPLVLVAQSSL